ncbi:MAG: AAA family ATPase [Myxococcota bacterium]
MRAPPLRPGELCWRCPDVEPTHNGSVSPIFGQARAVAALEAGLAVASPGHNIFVSGPSGSGRLSTVQAVLESARLRTPARLRDLLYLHNFDEPSRPTLLRLDPGQGRRFQRALEALLSRVGAELRALLEGDGLRAERDRTTKLYRKKQREPIDALAAELGEHAMALAQVEEEVAPEIRAVCGKELVPLEALRVDKEAAQAFVRARLGSLPEDPAEAERAVEAELVRARAYEQTMAETLDGLLGQAQKLERDLDRALIDLERARAKPLVHGLIQELQESLDDPRVRRHLARLEEQVLVDLRCFRAEAEDPEPLRMFRANLVRDATDLRAAPIVFEPTPSFTNVFGTVERDRPGDPPGSDFLSIRGGALLRADGGYLILYARDVLLEPGVWRNLARVLRSSKLEIRPPAAALEMVPIAINPEPVTLDLKVILIGEEDLYELLWSVEDDFPKVFKTKVAFELWAENTPASIAALAEAMRSFAEKEQLPRPDGSAIARLCEEAARRSGSRQRLDTHFGSLADLLRESAGGTVIDRAAIQAAIVARRARHDLHDRAISAAHREGVLELELSGARVGQVNALAVFEEEPISFGRPMRVTAVAGAGRAGLISIERESRLSGPIHDKAVLILGGYLRHRYGRRRPLTLSLSVSFEQSYGPIEGDSASLAELFVVLSAVSEVPIRQDLAITGSISQLGDVQAVGGINEKIEGFLRTCKEAGLTGTQGVLIPASCQGALMLDAEVVEAVAAGSFSVIPVADVDAAIPWLFDMEAEELHRRVAVALDRFAEFDAGPREAERGAPPAIAPARERKSPEDPRPPSAGS